MPDPDRVLTQQDLAEELTLLREHAGLTVRQVARVSQIPLSTVGGYFAGRHLPPATQPDQLPRILAACRETDRSRLERWQQALIRARRSPGKRHTGAAAPYRGLASFQPQDAEWFFGREELTQHLARLAVSTGSATVPLLVVGASGAGKSSLLRAGLLPRLVTGQPDASRAAVLTPGGSPVAALAAALSDLGPGDAGGQPTPGLTARLREAPDRCAELIAEGGQQAAIIVDQFEEVFGPGVDEAERQTFITALSALSGPAIVVLGMRADFYGHALRYPELAGALQERQIVVGPMTAEQLRRAIVGPAQKAGLDVEDGLVEVLLRDLRPLPADGDPGTEAGTLPLLSHALLATWERCHGSRLTIADYQASGGINDAIARSAELAYASLDEDSQRVARRLFAELVHVADDGRETRARLPLRELADGPDGELATAVLEQFVAHRLVTLDADAADITHEALLSAWPRLRAWIDADRDDIRARRLISAQAQTWQHGGREPGSLLRGGSLAIARDWVAEPVRRLSLSPLARAFVDASIAEDQAQQEAQRRRTRRLRQLVAGLTAAVLVTIGLTGYAFDQRQHATTAERVAQSRTVAIEANQLRGEDPGLAAQLSLAAYQIAPTAGARASLLASSGTPAGARLRDSASVVQAVALAPDRALLAVAAADGSLRLWDVTRPGQPLPGQALLGRTGTALYTTAFSPDGRLLAAAGANGLLRLWRVGPSGATPLGPALTGTQATIYSVAFAPNGTELAAGSADHTIRLWDLSDPARPRLLGAPLTGPAQAVMSVAFAPGGTVLAAGSADATVRLWNVADPARPARLGAPLTGPGGEVFSVAFSPDGRTLAAGSRNASVWLWNVADPARPARARAPLTGAQDWVNAVAFSPDGRTLAAASSDDRVLLWDVATGALTGALPNPQPATSVTWDGPHLLIGGNADGFARTWRVPPPVLTTPGPVNGVSFAPRGGGLAVAGSSLQVWNAASHVLAGSATIPGGTANSVNTVAFAPGGTFLAAGYTDGQVQLWRRGPGQRLSPASPPQVASAPGESSHMVEFVAFRRDGRVLATGADDGTVRLWSVAPAGGLRLLATIQDAHNFNYVFSVAFSPDGRTLAAASTDDLTRLWNVADPSHPARLGAPLAGPSSYAISVAFSPDGRTLAVGSADKTVRLWDVADPARPTRLGPPLTGPGGYVYSVAFSPDGRSLAGGVTDGSVWLWNVTDPARPAQLATFTGLAGHIYSVAFSPNGARLAAGGSAGSVWLWDTQPQAAARSVCAMPGQPLTPAEWHAYVPGRPYAPPCGR